jgi:hypothetical protein
MFLVMVSYCPFGLCTLPLPGHGLHPLKAQYSKPYLTASAQLYSFIIPGLSCCLFLQLSLSSLYPRHTCTHDFSPPLLLPQYTNEPLQRSNQVPLPLLLLVPSPHTDNCYPLIGYLTAPFWLGLVYATPDFSRSLVCFPLCP